MEYADTHTQTPKPDTQETCPKRATAGTRFYIPSRDKAGKGPAQLHCRLDANVANVHSLKPHERSKDLACQLDSSSKTLALGFCVDASGPGLDKDQDGRRGGGPRTGLIGCHSPPSSSIQAMPCPKCQTMKQASCWCAALPHGQPRRMEEGQRGRFRSKEEEARGILGFHWHSERSMYLHKTRVSINLVRC